MTKQQVLDLGYRPLVDADIGKEFGVDLELDVIAIENNNLQDYSMGDEIVTKVTILSTSGVGEDIYFEFGENYGDNAPPTLSPHVLIKKNNTVVYENTTQNKITQNVIITMSDGEVITDVFSFDGYWYGEYWENNGFNEIFYVKPKSNGYSITFEENGGNTQTDLTSQSVLPNPLPVPIKNGYTFSGWCYDINLENAAAPGDTLSGNVILYAKWILNTYSITFEENGGSTVTDLTEQTNLPSPLPTTTKSGYTFNGWYYESNFTTQAQASDTLSANVTLYAKWTLNTYTITFEENGGSSVSPITETTELPSPLPTTTKANHVFAGWYYDNLFTQKANAGDELTTNVTLYAKWYTPTTWCEDIADAIREKEGTTDPIKHLDFSERILAIDSGIDVSDANAVVGDVLTGKTFYAVDDTKKTGTMADNGTVNTDITTKAQEVTIQQGYHSGSGKVKISSTEQAKIVADNIKSGVSILGQAGGLTPAKAEETKTVTPNFASGNVVVTPTTDKVMTQVTINKDTTNHIAGNIKKDITLYGVTGTGLTIEGQQIVRGILTGTVDEFDTVYTQYFGNGVNWDSGGTKLSGIEALAGYGFGIAFSSDDTYMAVTHYTSPFITVYKRLGDTFTKLSGIEGLASSAYVGNSVAFSSDATYMAVAQSGNNSGDTCITVYKRSEDTFTKLSGIEAPSNTGNGVAFSSDDTYMAVAHDGSPYITVYKRSGDTFTKLSGIAALASDGMGVAFSSNGIYLAVTHWGSPYITVYKRSGDVFTKLTGIAGLAGNGKGVAFSSDDIYMAVTHYTSPFITVYKRLGDTFTKLSGIEGLASSAYVGNSVAFSSDATYMAVTHYTNSYITVYKRSGDIFTKLSGIEALAGYGFGIAFSSDDTYMAVTHYTSPFITVYKAPLKDPTILITPASNTIPAGFDDLGYATESGIEDDEIDIVSIFRTTT